MVVYRTRSYIQILYALILRAGYIFVIIFALIHYQDNPLVSSFVSLICFIFFLVTGKEEIVVFSNAVEYKNNSIIKLLDKKFFFALNDISNIDVKGTFTTGDELYNPTMTTERPLNELTIQLKNGENITIKTSIYINQLRKVKDEVKRMISIPKAE